MYIKLTTIFSVTATKFSFTRVQKLAFNMILINNTNMFCTQHKLCEKVHNYLTKEVLCRWWINIGKCWWKNGAVMNFSTWNIFRPSLSLTLSLFMYVCFSFFHSFNILLLTCSKPYFNSISKKLYSLAWAGLWGTAGWFAWDEPDVGVGRVTSYLLRVGEWVCERERERKR